MEEFRICDENVNSVTSGGSKGARDTPPPNFHYRTLVALDHILPPPPPLPQMDFLDPPPVMITKSELTMTNQGMEYMYILYVCVL